MAITDSTPDTNRSRTRRITWIVLICAGVLLLTLALVAMSGCAQYLGKAIVYLPNTDKNIDFAADMNDEELAVLGVDAGLRVAVGPPDASLSVWLINPDHDRIGGTIIVLHGINDRKKSMLDFSSAFAHAGFRVVLVDLRGHGRSTGRYATFGVIESRDISQLIDALQHKQLIAGRIGIFGPSYGGAVALQSARSDDRIDAVVTVSTFTSMREIVPRYTQIYLPFGRWLPKSKIDSAIEHAGRIADFKIDDANTLNAMAELDTPVLLIHGEEDTHIPSSHARRLQAAARGVAELVIVEGADHDTTMSEHGSRILEESLRWFRRWL